jgi:putative ABC transport system permease protein
MLTDWILRLRSLFGRDRVERELDDEMRFHLDQQIDSYLRDGLTRDQAIRRAALEFGRLDQIREEHRDARGISLLAHLGRDLRHAFRQLRRAPAFSALAVLCLGLGIGVNTSIFSVLNAAMFRPMPVQNPERLVVLSRGQEATFSFPSYRGLLERSRTLAGLTASMPYESDLDVDGESQFVAEESVSRNYASVMGVGTVIGRWFTDDRELQAVISYAIWQRRFGSSPDVVGRRIRSQSESYTIVGVAPPEYTGVFSPVRTDLWVPIQTRPSLARLQNDARTRVVMLFGRVGPGLTAAQSAAEVNAIDSQLATEQGTRAELTLPISLDQVRGISNPGTRRRAAIIATFLSVVVGLVLLIACVNVGNLLLVRGAVRQREFALRRALGASRGRMLQQLLAESLIVAALGGVCGVVLARWTNGLLQRSLPVLQGMFPMQLDFSLDWRTIVYAALVSAGVEGIAHQRTRCVQRRDRNRQAAHASPRTRRPGGDVAGAARRVGHVHSGPAADAGGRSRLRRGRPSLRLYVHLDAGTHPGRSTSDLRQRPRSAARAAGSPSIVDLRFAPAALELDRLRSDDEPCPNAGDRIRGATELLRHPGHPGDRRS